jgi:hypothetical protein
LNQFWFFHVVCLFRFASLKIIKNDWVESEFRQKIFEIYIDIQYFAVLTAANSFRNVRDAARYRGNRYRDAFRWWSVVSSRRKIGAAVKQAKDELSPKAIADLTGMKAVNVRVLPGNGSSRRYQPATRWLLRCHLSRSS